MAAVAHSSEAVERVRGLQQSLEASLLRQREELSQHLSKRIDHYSKEAENAAVARVLDLLEPRVADLERGLAAQVVTLDDLTSFNRQGLDSLEARQEVAGAGIAALRVRAALTEDQVSELQAGLVQERRNREVRCQELADTDAQLAAADAQERSERLGAEEEAAHALRAAAAKAAEETRQAVSSADQQLADLSRDVIARDSRQTASLSEQVMACLEEASQRMNRLASEQRERLQDAADHAATQVQQCRAHADSITGTTRATLRDEQEDATLRSRNHAEEFAAQETARATEQLSSQLAQLGRQVESDRAEVTAKLWEALAKLEGRLADERAGHRAELQTMANDHSVKVNFLSSATIGQRSLSQGQASAAPTGAKQPELHHLSLKARNETLLRGQVEDLHAALADLETRVVSDLDGLRADVQVRASNHESYTRLEANASDLAARIARVRAESEETKCRSQKEMFALSNEVATLKTASNSLADGVVKALEALGMLDTAAAMPAAPPALMDGSTVAMHTPRNPRRGLAIAGGASLGSAAGPPHLPPPRPLRPKAGAPVSVDDLLYWEKTGQSLAARVTAAKPPPPLSGGPSPFSSGEMRSSAAR